MELPPLIVGLDVETSGWDTKSSFTAQERHLRQNLCSEDHTRDAGCICQLGWAVFRPSGDGEYHEKPPTTLTVQLPASEFFTTSGLDWHRKNGTGLNDDVCRQDGMNFEDALGLLGVHNRPLYQ